MELLLDDLPSLDLCAILSMDVLRLSVVDVDGRTTLRAEVVGGRDSCSSFLVIATFSL
jgi:hypothetical protein